MKVSSLKKDQQLSVRINSELKKKLGSKGMSPQKVLNNYLDRHFKIDEKLEIKEKR